MLVVSVGVIMASYALGTVPTAQLVAARSGHDPTREGSGNPGASNVYRVAGRTAGVIVLLVDLAKGVVPATVGLLLDGPTLAALAGAAAVLGHVAPAWRGFRGGKGVATAGGAALVVWPLVSAALIVVFVVLAATVRIASVGSLAMAVGLPVGVAVVGRPAVEIAVAAVVAIVVIARHHENLRRLWRGEERRLDPNEPSTGATEPT
ncbi:MAG: glycerol-3-phosphate 1-O-acyltransferase PlsY [Acidimicrobiales bacterium]